MNALRTTFRFAVTACLLLSLSTASVYPHLTASEPIESAAKSRGKRVCCCGTKDGRCCGKACCQLPNPKEDKAPTLPKSWEDRGQPLAIAHDVTTEVGGGNAATCLNGLFAGPAVANGSSLIALCIRINV